MHNVVVTAPASPLVQIVPNANLIVHAQTVAVEMLLSQEPLAQVVKHNVRPSLSHFDINRLTDIWFFIVAREAKEASKAKEAAAKAAAAKKAAEREAAAREAAQRKAAEKAAASKKAAEKRAAEKEAAARKAAEKANKR